ncbi:MAG: EcsC family protein [Chloroflexi bacterium]|nr:EcsC family protein [Chloroflexota bacterium]
MTDSDNILILLVLCCLFPFVIIVMLSVWAIRQGNRFIVPEIDEVRAEFNQLKQKYPDASTETLAGRVIRKQALRSAIVGGITSVGGIFLLPIGLAVDMYSSARIQATMLQFLAWAYEGERTTDTLSLEKALRLQASNTAKQVAIASGQRISTSVSRRIMVIVAEKSFAKLIPLLGAVLGFGLNYATTRAMGEVARKYYLRQKQR